MSSVLNTIEEALEDLRNGKLIIVVDDEDRENEGDFICTANKVTPEIINFMATHGRGLICAAITEERCNELGLEMMVTHNTAEHSTAFTVSVDLLGNGCTTGISASDRSKTIQALINPKTRPDEFGKPGHIFPLKAKKGGVLRRAGHTEATIDLARMAGFEPAGALVEIMNEDGTMARLPQLLEIAKKHQLRIISIEDLIAYRIKNETIIQKDVQVKMPTQWGEFDLVAYHLTTTEQEHLALIKGTWEKDEPILVRVHSSCLTGDIFGSCRCDCGAQLHKSMEMIEKAGKEGVQILCLQEVFNGPYFCAEQKTKWYEMTEKIPDGPTVKLMQKRSGLKGHQIMNQKADKSEQMAAMTTQLAQHYPRRCC